MSMFVMVYPGKRYGVYISYEGEDNGEFIVLALNLKAFTKSYR